MEEIQGAVLNLAVAVVVSLVGWVARSVTKYLDSKGVVNAIRAKETSVLIAVDAIEQIARNEKVPDKFKAAKHMAIEFLATQGISITDEELEVLIESAVAEINKGVAEGLGKAGN